jgi:two-component system cell cycle sensor histidine kinase/response regulator CckA
MTAHLLVADDDELVRSGLRLNLERAGYRVTTAASGEEALILAAREQIDLLLCDLVMTGCDGLAVLREVRARRPDLPVILVTGHGSIGNALEALQAGACDYIQKPTSPEEMAHRVRVALDQHRLRQSLAGERKRAEQRRRETDEQLARSERMASLGLMAEGAAADLERILAPLSDLQRRLRAGEAGGPEAADALETLTRRANAVVEDLQVIGSSGQPQREPVQVSAVVKEFVQSPAYQRLRRAHPQVRLEVHAGGLLPQVPAAPAALAQVVENLLVNACESAAPAGQVDLTLVLEQVDRPVGRYGRGAPGQYVVLRVRDSGPQLSAEDRERFFEPFYAQKRLARQELSGLGLTLVHRVVADHGGFVDLTHEGGGNVFHIYLPAHGEAARAAQATCSGTERVLVVDDYPAHREQAGNLLEALGYQVLRAGSSAEALATCRQQAAAGQEVHLVVMDLLLGEAVDGVEVVRELREQQPSLRAVLVSGFAEIARIVEARKLGLRQCLQKPLSAEALGRAVRAELDHPV